MTAISNAKWIALAQFSRILSQVANIIVLARFLPPADYGLMGMAMVITNLALLLRDMGTAAAIIQIKDLDDEIITSVFWMNVVLGVIVFLIILATSSLVAIYFKASELTPVLCLLAFIFPISSMTSAQKALLERKSNFRPVAQSEIFSVIFAIIFAVIAAVAGLGVYSFVIQSVSTAIISSLLIWLASDWRPTLKPSFSRINEVLPFSGHMTGFQVIFYCTRNLDTVVIGRMLSANALGMYSVASKIMLLPIQNISWIASRALYPLMSRQQDSLKEMGQLFLQTIGFISFISAPLMMGIFVLREPFVSHLLGSKWNQVAQILVYLAPIGYIQSIVGMNTTVMMAQGKTKFLMWFSIFSGAVLTISFIVGAKFGIEGVSSGYLVASIVSAMPILWVSIKLIHVSLRQWILELSGSILSSILMGIIVRLIYIQYKSYIDKSITAFVLDILVGALVYVLVSYFVLPQQVKSILTAFRKVRPLKKI